MEDSNATTPLSDEVRCAQCGTRLAEGQDREVTDDGTFCRPCFNNLTAELHQALAEQGRHINYPMAFVGGLAGGALGIAAWWGFTVLTNIAFGLVAVVIGIAVGKGVTILSGHKRHRNLQIMAVVIATLSFAYATYLVNRTLIHKAFTEEGRDVVLPLLPDPMLFVNVIQLGFNLFDVVFLAIVIWEAWRLPAPIALTGSRVA